MKKLASIIFTALIFLTGCKDHSCEKLYRTAWYGDHIGAPFCESEEEKFRFFLTVQEYNGSPEIYYYSLKWMLDDIQERQKSPYSSPKSPKSPFVLQCSDGILSGDWKYKGDGAAKLQINPDGTLQLGDFTLHPATPEIIETFRKQEHLKSMVPRN